MKAVSAVATRVAEIDFAVLDDRVVPVGNVDRSVPSPETNANRTIKPLSKIMLVGKMNRIRV